jgi:hypothetical protein
VSLLIVSSSSTQRLGSLFDSGNARGNQTLTYSAPKQPKQTPAQTTPTNPTKEEAPALLVASAVQLFK